MYNLPTYNVDTDTRAIVTFTRVSSEFFFSKSETLRKVVENEGVEKIATMDIP